MCLLSPTVHDSASKPDHGGDSAPPPLCNSGQANMLLVIARVVAGRGVTRDPAGYAVVSCTVCVPLPYLHDHGGGGPPRPVGWGTTSKVSSPS